MGKRKCPACAKPPAPIRPSWADPTLVMQLTALRVTTTDLGPGGTKEVVPADPKRVALGLRLGAAAVNPAAFYPAGSGADFGWTLTASSDPLWFDLFTFGPLVTAAWLSDAAFNLPVAVYEIYILPGR